MRLVGLALDPFPKIAGGSRPNTVHTLPTIAYFEASRE